MTATAAVSLELADTPCSVADCLDPAHVMGRATLRTDAESTPALEPVTLGLPLCLAHADLLRPGCLLSEFDSGL